MSKLIDGESVDNNGVEVSADREPIAPEVLEGRRLRGFPDVDKGKTSGPVTLEDGSVLTGGRDRQSAHGRPLADRYLGPSVPHAWPYAVAFLALGMLLIWPLVGALRLHRSVGDEVAGR